MEDQSITGKTLLELAASVRIVGHQQAAKGQLEQAIFLWFHKGDEFVLSDATAIHTLGIAVQGILWAYAHDSRQRPSTVKQALEKMDPEQRAPLIDPQNFFKHGNVGRKEKGKRKAVSHLPDATDLFLCDDVCTFGRLFGISSGYMDTFLLRYSLSFPKSGIRLHTLEMKLISSGFNIQTLAALDRKSFFDLVSPYAAANLREQAAAHSADPPPEKP